MPRPFVLTPGGSGGAIENADGNMYCGPYGLASYLTISHNRSGTGPGTAVDATGGGFTGLLDATSAARDGRARGQPAAGRPGAPLV